MATPALVTVTGRVMIDKETPDPKASIMFARSVYLRHEDGTFYEPATVTAPVDADGNFSVSLMKGTDPAWAPVNWSYEITIKPRGTDAPYTFSAIVDGTTSMSFGDLIPLVSPTSGQMYVLVSSRSVAGGVAGLDADGDVISASGQKVRAWSHITGKPDLTERVCSVGEFVLRRGDINGVSPATANNIWVTHFTAAVTETILTIRTNTGGPETLATGGTHAWVGVLSWDGTAYTPLCVSADDPTLWTSQDANYDTPIFGVDGSGLANLASPGFQKVAGNRYAFFVLWIGPWETPPSLPSGLGNPGDSLVEPRTNARIWQEGPPGSVFQGVWFAADGPRFQGLMKR